MGSSQWCGFWWRDATQSVMNVPAGTGSVRVSPVVGEVSVKAVSSADTLGMPTTEGNRRRASFITLVRAADEREDGAQRGGRGDVRKGVGE